MSATFQVDMTGFQKAMKAYQSASKKTAQQVLVAQAQKLISSQFKEPGDAPGSGGLYQEARKEAPATKAAIRGLTNYLWLYRSPTKRRNYNVSGEIAKRLKRAGYVQSTGWLNRVYALRGKGSARARTVRMVGKPRGRVIQKFSGGNPSIEIINETPGAVAFANKTGYVSRALSNRERDMARYCQRKMVEAGRKSGFHAA